MDQPLPSAHAGQAHCGHFGIEYMVRAPILAAVRIAAILTADRRFHALFVIVALACQVSWILRLFDNIL